ncbi:fimbrial protein [Pantoea endophytica]
MFKKIMLSAAIVAAMGTTAVQAATSGTISFEGSIVDATCTVDTSANITQTVNLGKQDAGDFDGVGTTVGQTPFSISLTDCNTDIDGASVTFSGDATTDGSLTTDYTTVGVEFTEDY